MRGSQRSDIPLVHRVIGNPVDADFAVTPCLCAGPLDAAIKIMRLTFGPHIEMSWRTARTAGVDADTGVTIWYPLLRVDKLPVLVLVAGSLQYFGGSLYQARPIPLVSFLERQTFCVGAVTQNHGIATGAD